MALIAFLFELHPPAAVGGALAIIGLPWQTSTDSGRFRPNDGWRGL